MTQSPPSTSETFPASQTAAKASPKKLRFQSLDMVRTPWTVTVIVSLLIIAIICLTTSAMFLPWRQSVTGTGKVIVFSPMNRPQSIEAQIPGRLIEWFVRDGQTVKKGELIATLADLDSRFLGETQLKTLQLQREALIARRSASELRIKALKSQVSNSSRVQGAAVPAARERIKQANDRVYAAEQSLAAARQSLQTATWQIDRITSLYNDGLRSKRDKELAELEKVRADTEVQKALAALDVAKEDANISRLESTRIVSDSSGVINSVQATLADADQTIASTNAEIFKLDVDIQNLTRRMEQRRVVAPRDGKVVRLMRVGAGETVNAGDVLAVLAPRTEDRAAEINIRDWDAPLVSVGHPVRLQIAGWPALQFIGWPRIAIGTFAGTVAVIDAVDDGKSRYRVIVVPDKDAIDKKIADPWPSTDYLRPGAQVTGWILLGNVPLWYELWRQFNGWQPTIPQPDVPDKDSKGKR